MARHVKLSKIIYVCIRDAFDEHINERGNYIMCMCTPSIKSPWCPKCSAAFMPAVTPLDRNIEAESFGAVKDLMIRMNGLSEIGFKNKYLNDPAFHKGVDYLVDLFGQNERRNK